MFLEGRRVEQQDGRGIIFVKPRQSVSVPGGKAREGKKKVTVESLYVGFAVVVRKHV